MKILQLIYCFYAIIVYSNLVTTADRRYYTSWRRKSKSIAHRSCSPAELACKNGECINSGWVCDGQNDCLDSSDETNCGTDCPLGLFSCGPPKNECIVLNWVCDKSSDCESQLDETDCDGPRTCPNGLFLCKRDSRCINPSWVCDGDEDCQNGEDESSDICVNSICEFKCEDDGGNSNTNTACIKRTQVCDGKLDCSSGSDERNCKIITCDKNEFQCRDKSCLPKFKVCDSTADCQNGEDEDNCQYTTTTAKSLIDAAGKKTTTCDSSLEFDCNAEIYGSLYHKADCRMKSLLCDGHTDCASGFDESEEMCSNDECRSWGFCSHPTQCYQVNGKSNCKCLPGYSIDSRTGRCKAIDPAWLMFAGRFELRALTTSHRHYVKIVDRAKHASAIAYDYAHRKIFWSEISSGAIRSVTVDDMMKFLTKEKLASEGVKTVEGLAYDWTTKNLYWTDAGSKTIEVIHTEEGYRKVLFDRNIDEPRAIVVDPRRGYMYWTDWLKNPRIERAGMDGSRREIFLEKRQDLRWPNGLSIDYVTNTLFWVDGSLHTINRISLDHGRLKASVILTSFTHLRLPFGLAVFEDNVYWTDWHTHAIYKCDKFTGVNLTTVLMQKYQLNGLAIYHRLLQPNVEDNPCRIDNGGCSHFCFLSPKLHPLHALSRKCQCPGMSTTSRNYVLDTDEKTCINLSPPTTTTTTTPIHQRSGLTEDTNNNNNNNNFPNPKQLPDDGNNNKMIGKVATIVVASLILLLILSTLMGYFVHLRYKKRYIRSMNFDNPIYRKTTETVDEDVLLKPNSANGNGTTSTQASTMSGIVILGDGGGFPTAVG